MILIIIINIIIIIIITIVVVLVVVKLTGIIRSEKIHPRINEEINLFDIKHIQWKNGLRGEYNSEHSYCITYVPALWTDIPPPYCIGSDQRIARQRLLKHVPTHNNGSSVSMDEYYSSLLGSSQRANELAR
jgi:hypothetical protein